MVEWGCASGQSIGITEIWWCTAVVFGQHDTPIEHAFGGQPFLVSIGLSVYQPQPNGPFNVYFFLYLGSLMLVGVFIDCLYIVLQAHSFTTHVPRGVRFWDETWCRCRGCVSCSLIQWQWLLKWCQRQWEWQRQWRIQVTGVSNQWHWK